MHVTNAITGPLKIYSCVAPAAKPYTIMQKGGLTDETLAPTLAD